MRPCFSMNLFIIQTQVETAMGKRASSLVKPFRFKTRQLSFERRVVIHMKIMSLTHSTISAEFIKSLS